MTADQVTLGQKVTYGEFAATVMRICEWSRNADEVMVEVRVPGGLTCVSCKDLEVTK